jgi:hypothetical protein
VLTRLIHLLMNQMLPDSCEQKQISGSRYDTGKTRMILYS